MTTTPPRLEIYWRPGCPYCSRLFSAIGAARLEAELHNIWEDPAAAAFVREHNRGNETVPTVVFGELVLTNPDPDDLLERVAAALQ